MKSSVGLFVLIMIAAAAHGQDSVDNYWPRTVLSRPMPPITEPAIISASEANVNENELVIGVVVNDQARAYPINQLTGPRREIINDTRFACSGSTSRGCWQRSIEKGPRFACSIRRSTAGR